VPAVDKKELQRCRSQRLSRNSASSNGLPAAQWLAWRSPRQAIPIAAPKIPFAVADYRPEL